MNPTDGHGEPINIGDLVEVPYPEKTDNWDGEMLANVTKFISDTVVEIKDDDDNYIKIESYRLNNL